ncbi:MAG TPA: hypothetical protein VFG03_22255 [Telluria sp.]|nr:hypothetical protein [Telluria sp.]
MRYKLIVLCMLLGSGSPAIAQIGFGAPGISIGINLSSYPQMVRVPGYPVYYASGVNSNFFFYDGMYWVYQDDNWYASSWYNGPWQLVSPDFVPLYVLRVPVRYYRSPPRYFLGWSREAPPRWNDHWGNQWAQRRSGWDQWNRKAAPAPAPLPRYQRQYSGRNYPLAAQQRQLESKNYRYQPRDQFVQQHVREQQRATPGQGGGPQGRNPGRDNREQSASPSPRQSAPANTDQRPQQQPRPQAQPREQPRPQPQAQPRQQPQEQPNPQAQQRPAPREQGGRGQENRSQGPDKAREGGGDRGPQRDKDNN